MAGTAGPVTEDCKRNVLEAHRLLTELIREHVGKKGTWGAVGLKLVMADGQVVKNMTVIETSHK